MGTNGRMKVERDPAEVRAQIQRAREDIAASISDLRREMAVRTDWREWVRQRPELFLGCAFAIGLWMGIRSNRAD